MTLTKLFLEIALFFPATTYGYGEKMCCDIGNPCACSSGAITASGDVFNPDIPTAALPFPSRLRIDPMDIYIKALDGKCIKVRINDKSNPRWIGNRGLDLSPKAVELITGKRTKFFKQELLRCKR